MNTLHSFSLQRKHDLLLARLRLRQIAGMLGFDPLEQAKIVGAAFELACREKERADRVVMTAGVEKQLLRVWFHDEADSTPPNVEDLSQPQMAMALPRDQLRMSVADLRWAIMQLDQIGEADIFEELRQHNQDLLCVLTLLHQTQAEAETTRTAGQQPFAA